MFLALGLSFGLFTLSVLLTNATRSHDSCYMTHNETAERFFSTCREIQKHRSLNSWPFPKSDQFQISPTASPEILHHAGWGTWLFIAYSDERWLHYQFSLQHLKVGRMCVSNVGGKGFHLKVSKAWTQNPRKAVALTWLTWPIPPAKCWTETRWTTDTKGSGLAAQHHGCSLRIANVQKHGAREHWKSPLWDRTKNIW